MLVIHFSDDIEFKPRAHTDMWDGMWVYKDDEITDGLLKQLVFEWSDRTPHLFSVPDECVIYKQEIESDVDGELILYNEYFIDANDIDKVVEVEANWGDVW